MKRTYLKFIFTSILLISGWCNLYAQLAADYAMESWTCEQVNSDTGEYWDSDGVRHDTNPLGHPEYLAAGRACDFRAILPQDGVPYAWGHWHTLGEFRNYIAAGRGAGNHKVHGSAPSWSTGIDCSGLLSRCWGEGIKRHSSWFAKGKGDVSNIYDNL